MEALTVFQLPFFLGPCCVINVHVSCVVVLSYMVCRVFGACAAAAAMSVQMIEEMLADVKLHIGVDTTAVDKDYQDFWQALLVLTKDALEKAERKRKVLEELRKNSSADAAAQAAAILANNTSVGDVRDADSGIAVGVTSDITAILSGKTPQELDALKDSIKVKLETEEDVDSAYWEAILQKIPLFRVINHK